MEIAYTPDDALDKMSGKSPMSLTDADIQRIADELSSTDAEEIFYAPDPLEKLLDPSYGTYFSKDEAKALLDNENCVEQVATLSEEASMGLLLRLREISIGRERLSHEQRSRLHQLKGILSDSDVIKSYYRICNEVRKKIADLLEKKGKKVVMPKQSINISTEDGSNRWEEVQGHPDLCCKIEKKTPSMPSNLPTHPNLVAEREVSIGNGYVAIFAPNLKGISTLAEAENTLSLEEKFKIIAGGMKGCQALHDVGLRHGDIHEANIFTNGMLADLTLVSPPKRRDEEPFNNLGLFRDSTYFRVSDDYSKYEDPDSFAFSVMLMKEALGTQKFQDMVQNELPKIQGRSELFDQSDFIEDNQKRPILNGEAAKAQEQLQVYLDQTLTESNISPEVRECLIKLWHIDHRQRIPVGEAAKIIEQAFHQ